MSICVRTDRCIVYDGKAQRKPRTCQRQAKIQLTRITTPKEDTSLMRIARQRGYTAWKTFRNLWNLGWQTATRTVRNFPIKVDRVHKDLTKSHHSYNRTERCNKNDEDRFCMPFIGRLANVLNDNHQWEIFLLICRSFCSLHVVDNYCETCTATYSLVGSELQAVCVCWWSRPMGDTHLTEWRTRRDLILLVMMLMFIVMVMMIYNRIELQFKNKDGLLLFWYLTSLVPHAVWQPKLDYCSSNFTEFRYSPITNLEIASLFWHENRYNIKASCQANFT